MPIYNTGIVRTSGAPDPFVPQPLADTIIQEAPKASAALRLMNTTTLSSKTQRQPVLDVLPMAYWVGGDTGMKQTTMMQWKNVVMVVEELACIVPIPEAYLDDADVPLWGQVQPRITEAVGALIDSAVLWGLNKPATWGEAVFPGAQKSGHVVLEGTGVDLGQDVSALGLTMAQTGYTVNGFAAMPGMSWKLVGLRSAQGIPIYQPDMQNGQPGGNLYGYNLSEINNGSWVIGATGAEILGGDFTKSIIGLRRDISFKMFTEGVVSDDNGKVLLNLMQQDTVAMRMTMRLAYATINPVTIMQPGSAITARWPFGAIVPVGATVPGPSAIDVKTGYPATGPQTAGVEAQRNEDGEEVLTMSQWEQRVHEERERQEAEQSETAEGTAQQQLESGKGRSGAAAKATDDDDEDKEPARRHQGGSGSGRRS